MKIKNLIYLLLVSLISATNTFAQNGIHLDVDNQSSCNWTVIVYDASSNAIVTHTVNAGVRWQPGCVPIGTASSDYITVDDGTCVVTFGSGGSFPYTSVNPCGGTTCSNSMDCSGGTPSICGPAPNNHWAIIRIF